MFNFKDKKSLPTNPAPSGFYITGDLSLIGYPFGVECEIPINTFTFASNLKSGLKIAALGPQHILFTTSDKKVF